MKKLFFVELVKTVQYHIEAENYDEAENMAIEMDNNKNAELLWASKPYEEIRVELE